ncbi:MAG: hypothetical protein ACK4SA_04800, partial [Caldilinea sp.]
CDLLAHGGFTVTNFLGAIATICVAFVFGTPVAAAADFSDDRDEEYGQANLSRADVFAAGIDPGGNLA